MKKLILAFTAFVSVMASAAITPHPKDGTISTNDLMKLTAEKTFVYRDVRVWPKTAPLAWELSGCSVKYPVTCSVYANYIGKSDKAFHEAYATAVKEDATAAELVGMLGEAMADETFVRNLKGCQAAIVDAIMKRGFAAVRVYLKKQGKPFVTKDGVNPCEPYMKGLSDALNAPRLAGLEAWFTSVGVTVTMDTKYIPADATIKSHWAKIVEGSEEITDYWSDMIRYGLGLDEYNKFVKEYNGQN